jgi:hypothetical protein
LDFTCGVVVLGAAFAPGHVPRVPAAVPVAVGAARPAASREMPRNSRIRADNWNRFLSGLAMIGRSFY